LHKPYTAVDARLRVHLVGSLVLANTVAPKQDTRQKVTG